MDGVTIEAVVKLGVWREDIVQFVVDNFGVAPDLWQEEALRAFASKDPDKQRIAMSACAGPGKSATIAWCALWFISMCYDDGEAPIGACVSESWDMLQDTLWKEINKWHRMSPFLESQFVWTKHRYYCKDFQETWYLTAKTYSKTANDEERGRTLSGLHSQNIAYFIDESGGMSVSVLKGAEQGLTNCTFGKIVTAGNPTSHTGLLYYAVEEDFENWHVICISGDPDDPLRSPRINIDDARRMIDKYGREDSWVMAYILGKFPKAAIDTLLTPDEVRAAINRGKDSALNAGIYNKSQKRLGIDVALYGDDKTVIFPRQGLRAFKPVVLRDTASDGQAPSMIAGRACQAKAKWGSEMEFVDCTGGYGDGVVNYMLDNNADPIRVVFSSKAGKDHIYFNKRTEMYLELRDWIRGGGILPDDPDLIKELSAHTYTFKGGKMALEEKDKVKDKIKRSPDKADALALTFALPDMPMGIGSLFPDINHLNLNNNDRQSSDWEPSYD